jgi:hypothetical protein
MREHSGTRRLSEKPILGSWGKTPNHKYALETGALTSSLTEPNSFINDSL